ncbi:hypothetical protein F5Y12DRAFT_719072 [Xylaria sp. FL1777]|nr:hypothetical protein F5Y12DRAFT_719072 [Xylaria sp. FL1777]
MGATELSGAMVPLYPGSLSRKSNAGDPLLRDNRAVAKNPNWSAACQITVLLCRHRPITKSHRITLEYIEGQTLQQAWPVLTPDQRLDILDQLRGYIAQLRALKGTQLNRLDGQGVIVPSIMTRSGGPFATLAEFHDWLVKPPQRLQSESIYWHQITTQLRAECPIIVALLDWEFAGWYPEYWDYVFALRGLDNVDWETLGLNVPSLFDKRYDLEYILIKFILTLS